MENLLIKILNKLYDTEGNSIIYDSQELIQEFNLADEKEIEYLLYTPSVHKNLLEIDKFMVKLTPKWRNYIENLRSPCFQRFILHINQLSGFYTVIIALWALIISVLSLYISIIKQ